MMACAAINCTNRHSQRCSVHFFRFPLGDKSRLQKWLVNIRRHKWNPTPSSRLCSVHFEDNCFFTSNMGKVRLTTAAVPTIFSFPKHLQKKPAHTRQRLERRGDVVLRNAEAVEEIVRVIVDESNGASEIHPGGRCNISYSHLPCHPSVPSDTVCHSKDHTYMAESPGTLQNSFNLANAKLTNYRKRLKRQSARIRRLEKKVTSLSSIVSELRQERRL
ncbi:hypothetical protein R3I94_016561 [Phoxinus phoxinus]